MANDLTEAAGSERPIPKVLTFHRLTREFTWSANNYRPKRMMSLLTRLESAGFSFVPLSEIDQRTAAGEKCCAITFDDGMAELANVLPRLVDRFRLQPTVFVPTGMIGRPNSWDYSYLLAPTRHLSVPEIRELARQGVAFGTHGHTHRCLLRLSRDCAMDELTQSKEVLEDILGQSLEAISYPFGRVNEVLIRQAEEAGYRHGNTMRYPGRQDHPLARGRMAVYGFDTASSVLRKLTPGIGNKVEKSIALAMNRLASGTVLLQRLRSFD